jgi:hypothetical protein
MLRNESCIIKILSEEGSFKISYKASNFRGVLDDQRLFHSSKLLLLLKLINIRVNKKRFNTLELCYVINCHSSK